MARQRPSRIRQIIDRIEAKTGEHSLYMGEDSRGSHYFSTGYIKGDTAALEYAKSLARVAGIEP